MLSVQELLTRDPYELGQKEKESLILEHLCALTKRHFDNSVEYQNILESIDYFSATNISTVEEVPYLPVSLFKELNLKSIKEEDIFKTLTSSGTTSQMVSKIFLDKETASLQTKTLAAIMKSYLGNTRNPMIIVDCKSILKDSKIFSARGAGILGMATFGRNHFYLLNDDMTPDFKGLEEFLEKFPYQKIFIFGFTFMIWLHFLKELNKNNQTLDLKNSIIFHGGGWKKLEHLGISNQLFKDEIEKCLNIENVHNFYGMVEQVGSIYVECEEGYLHAPVFSDIIIRDFKTWKVLPIGSHGVVQTLSIIPLSYPGHSLLTEDMGIIHGVDDCKCGKKGKYFTISGRIPKVEVRGCSDTYTESEAP
jgi:phenylacetate-coenzyme A ligase PaaK-like adenylate-forming protein